MSTHKSLVRPFYDSCLTVRPAGDPSQVASVLGDLLADDFRSINAAETKGKAQLIGQVQFFWKLNSPTSSGEPQELLEDGDKVVVRSLASGSPRGEFMGRTLDGFAAAVFASS